ncbi:MAG TPA: hypothetical protein GX514_07845 [Thermoanaerobacterales bacterium]|uniref:CLC_0170 family protein n=1 Tax=Tepidanaerobacter sp. GT38 TaxID=2722793 RepID=UPI0017E269D1|nr:CLC_0170 family protein [Tepidanaerobacter sp. GT38]MCG1011372.1 hypothetical protein [Tepidanaerobacter sp. GT38]HHY42743.1 hypothetical protein [Thermoanaerobacterales bacterium]
MVEVIKMLADNVVHNISFTTLAVFILSGIYLLTIDRLDLSIKGLKTEEKAVTIIGILYIFGSLAVFVFFRYFVM